MKEEDLGPAKNYFIDLEKQISLLPKEQQEILFKRCATRCVTKYVLPSLKGRKERTKSDLDLFFSGKENSEYSFQRVIEKGHIYEMGYPQCLCFMHDLGFAQSKIHCECSRQSILFVLQELFPDKDFSVETIDTVLGGADKCTFRVMVSSKVHLV
jgi:hypothetical protein